MNFRSIRDQLPLGDDGEEQNLRRFIEDFLVPIAADGSIGVDEELPLLVAFHAYGIGGLYARNPETFCERLRAAIDDSRRAGPTRSDVPRLRAAFRNLLHHGIRLSWSQRLQAMSWGRLSSGTFISGVDRVPNDLDFGPARETAIPLAAQQAFGSMMAAVWPDGAHAWAGGQSAEMRTPSKPGDETLGAIDTSVLEGRAAARKQEAGASADSDPHIVEFEADERVIGRMIDGKTQAALAKQASSILDRFEVRLGHGGHLGLAFDRCRKSADAKVIIVGDGAIDERETWLIGDLHGDLLALECILAHIKAQSREAARARIVFLGDLIDDGPCSAQVLIRLFGLIADEPHRIAYLCGNHDEGLIMRDGHFTSSVTPADFADELNADTAPGWCRRAAELFIKLVSAAPRAIFLSDGTLLAHGGIPQSDLWSAIDTPDAMENPTCLQDFVWTRAHPRARRREPSRASKGAEFGRDDFAGFCELASRIVGFPVRRMIRGHDHFEQRFDVYPAYRTHRPVTINAMSMRLPREILGKPVRMPCVARMRAGDTPEIHRLRIPPKAVRTLYPERFSDQDTVEVE